MLLKITEYFCGLFDSQRNPDLIDCRPNKFLLMVSSRPVNMPIFIEYTIHPMLEVFLLEQQIKCFVELRMIADRCIGVTPEDEAERVSLCKMPNDHSS